jgi:polyhydroxyalkanoate synthesis regulator phasin
MYNLNDIVTRLQNGEDSEIIAGEMSQLLNDAMKEVAKRKEEEKAKIEQEMLLTELSGAVVNSVKNYFAVACPSLAGELEISPEEAKKMMDEVVKAIKPYEKILKGLKAKREKTPEGEKKVTTYKGKMSAAEADKLIKDFLKFGI